MASHFIAERFAAAGLEVTRQDIGRGAVNVIGVKPAGREAVLLSAHYDHLGIGPDGRVYPGADDNASGVAVLLALVDATSRAHFDRTLIFIATGAEEVGLLGMGRYIADPVWPLERTVLVINFDMVGRNFFEWGSGRAHTAAIVGRETRADLSAAAHRAAGRAGLDLVPVDARLVELFGFQDRTDEWWFRRRGMAAIHLSTSLHRDYHKPSDTVDKLVPSQLERVAKTTRFLLDEVAGESR